MSDVQKNNIQHCDGFGVASAQCQMYKKDNIQHCDGFVMASAQCQMYKKKKNCDGIVVASAQCQMYNIVMALSWLLLSVRCTKKQHTTL